uniref:Uncharacterized protein n=1 Tax=viral metagenome TaxID=1070528 RepID=A0A6H2A136_9ZZZZ
MKSLKNRLKEIEPLFTTEWPTQEVDTKLNTQVQTSFLGFDRINHIRMGYFYEVISKCLFGGVLRDNQMIESQEYHQICPDVYNKSRKILVESKAMRIGHHTTFIDDQINRYIKYQQMKHHYKIYWCFWRHRFEKIKSYKGSPNELYQSLCEKTAYGIILGFSIIIDLWKETHTNSRRYENTSWYNCTTINSTDMNRFLFEPEIMLTQIGRDPNNYAIARFRSPYLKINRYTMSPKPFILIFEKDHQRLIKDLGEEEVPF